MISLDVSSKQFNIEKMSLISKGTDNSRRDSIYRWEKTFNTPVKLNKLEFYISFKSYSSKSGCYRGSSLEITYDDGTTTKNPGPGSSGGAAGINITEGTKEIEVDNVKKVSKISVYINLDYFESLRTYSNYGYIKIPTIDGLLTSLQPLNFLNKSRVTGFNISGIEPANTSRHVAFKVDDVWNKLAISSGTASLTALETQEITADSLIAEGNTVAELQSVTDCTPFVGKLVYPAVALYADSSAEVMPTFGMTVNALIDTTVNVYSFTDYSQEYAISDGDDVSIISLVAETELKGNGKVDITARIKSNGEWSEYMSLNAVQMKQASAIQLKAVYTVSNTDGSDSAKITSVVIKYNTAGAVTSTSTTEIVTVTQKFTNDLTYVHAYCKHKELIDAKINAYCSIRKQPQKRVQYQVGNGTGALKTYILPDSGVNQDTLAVYVDGKFISDFGYNTETSEITLTADKDAVVSASYEYGWEMSDWLPMEQGVSQINDSGNYTTEYTYTIPSHDGIFTVTAVKFELARPEGHVDNETIGTGTGRRQMIRLPHIARKETIVCNGKWSYDYDNQRLTIIAPENEPIVISYDWIAESPKVYSVAAGWAD